MSEERRPHLSPSQIDLFTKCPEAYRRRYIEREVIPPGIAMAKGTGLHGGSETNFRQKIETWRDLPESDIVDAAVATFETELDRRGYQLSDEEMARGATVVIAEAKDDVAAMAKAHAKSQAPEYQPVLVEEPVRIEMPDADYDMFGYLDLLAHEPTETPSWDAIVDFKTGAKARPKGDVDSSVQLTFYAAAAHIIREKPVDEVRLEVLIKGSQGVRRQLLTSTRDEHDYAALTRRVQAVWAAVQAGVFTPAKPDAWWCSPRWCGYWHTCPFVNSERLAKAETKS